MQVWRRKTDVLLLIGRDVKYARQRNGQIPTGRRARCAKSTGGICFILNPKNAKEDTSADLARCASSASGRATGGNGGAA